MRSLIALSTTALLFIACGDEGNTPAKTGTLTVSAIIAPDPPKVGQNILTVTVTREGKPLEGATVTVDPQMPMHGHGSSETAKIVEKGQGVYVASPVTLQMPGMWEITVSAAKEQLEGETLLKVDVR